MSQSFLPSFLFHKCRICFLPFSHKFAILLSKNSVFPYFFQFFCSLPKFFFFLVNFFKINSRQRNRPLIMFFLLLIFLLLLVAVAIAYYKMTKTTPTQTNKKRSGETNNDKASKKREIEDPASSEGMYIFKCIIFIINNVINFLFVNIK